MKKILFYFVVVLCTSHLVYAGLTQYTIKKVWCERCAATDTNGTSSQLVTNTADTWQNARNNVIPSGLRDKCRANGTTVTCDIYNVDQGRRYFTMEDCINSRDTEMSASTARCDAVANGGAVLTCLLDYKWMRWKPDQGTRACRKEHTITYSDPLSYLKDHSVPYNSNVKANIGVLPSEYQSYCRVININGTSFECTKTNDFWNTDRCETYLAKKKITSAAATCTASEYVPSVSLACKNGVDVFNPTVTEENGECVYKAAYEWTDASGEVTPMGYITSTESIYSEVLAMNNSGLFPIGTECTYDTEANKVTCGFKHYLTEQKCEKAKSNDASTLRPFECQPSGESTSKGAMYELVKTKNSATCNDGLRPADDGTSCQK